METTEAFGGVSN